MIKSLAIAIATFTFAAHSFAAETVVKECSTTINSPEGGAPLQLNVKIMSKEDKTVYAKIVENDGKNTSTYDDTAEISEGSVRENLNVDGDDLNDAERLIAHALNVSKDPVLKKLFSTGIDLTKVRSAKMYLVGERTKFGSATIVEAKDANGKDLGSFLGGFLIGACK